MLGTWGLRLVQPGCRRNQRTTELYDMALGPWQLRNLYYEPGTSEAARLGEDQPHFNCKLASASGLPAIAVPAGFGRDEMPVAIELMAEPWAEQKLLDLAYTIEGLHPARRLPTSTP